MMGWAMSKVTITIDPSLIAARLVGLALVVGFLWWGYGVSMGPDQPEPACSLPITPEKAARIRGANRASAAQMAAASRQWHRDPVSRDRRRRVEGGWLYDSGILNSPVFVPDGGVK